MAPCIGITRYCTNDTPPRMLVVLTPAALLLELTFFHGTSALVRRCSMSAGGVYPRVLSMRLIAPMTS